MKVIIDYFMTRKPSISRRNRINWHYVRDDVLFSTIKVVSRHQSTQQYGAILPIELTTDKIRNSKDYEEYYACAMGEAAPKPKASTRKKKGESASSTTPPTLTPTTTVESAPRLSATAKGKQPSRATTPIEPIDVQRTEAEQLKIVLSRQETHISQQSGSGTDKGTGSKPGVVSRHQTTQQYGAILPIELTTAEIRNNKAYKEYHACVMGEAAPKPKASAKKKKGTGKGGDEVRESEGESDDEETREEDEESEAPIPPLTIPCIILENLPTFNSAFRFEERL
nr:hypothetical protein [Tanacetum cinerariifolium]